MWLLAKWFGGYTVRVLCPVVASAVGLVKSEKETVLLLFGHGLTFQTTVKNTLLSQGFSVCEH